MASRYRLKRGPVLGLLLIIGVVGGLLVVRGSTRPVVDVYGAVAVPDAYEGTTYAFDGLVCLRASSIGASVGSVTTSGSTRIGLQPEGSRVAVAYPVPPEALGSLDGAEIAAGDQLCTRLVVTADGTGERRADPVRVQFRYGPFGLLRSTTTVQPPVTLQVTGTGPDPRAEAA